MPTQLLEHSHSLPEYDHTRPTRIKNLPMNSRLFHGFQQPYRLSRFPTPDAVTRSIDRSPEQLLTPGSTPEPQAMQDGTVLGAAMGHSGSFEEVTLHYARTGIFPE